MRSVTDRRPPQPGDARRDAILDALDRCLQETSFDAVSLAAVARQAGVSRSAFYFYFENKAAAVAALMERMYDDTFFVNDVFTLGADSPRARVRTMLDGLFDTWERHQHLFAAMLAARGHSPAVRQLWDNARESFVDSVAGMIRAERAAGAAPDGLDATVLASVLLEFNDRMLERLTTGGALTRQQLMDGAAAIWLSSVYGLTS
ncbi:TetR/AcrR family transcriptional regulator [Mycobacterium talmoniae]|uniref:HTH-type transcriptional regulator EthR n=1 Tax=Mycobacterium talmoniae TaxID=1858794 RepID=A0A1S1NDK8_9MYCO|nr:MULTISPECIES: TetR/AcrR family transcriptional regulator [Mycobacterium]OHU96429.1 TetR family transcriptional regulator [Mycobacterium talmoniae]PQM47626.1 HTH-type transcriptional regulator EthR [Mycobacterium talmoniae]TDH52262.1 TetR/AcrR family transcriptional regulator [Mycobacterium eburneum]